MLYRSVFLALTAILLAATIPSRPLQMDPPRALISIPHLTLTTTFKRPPFKPSPVDAEIARIEAWIHRINPKLDAGRAHRVANELLCQARATCLDPRLVMSLIAVESAFHPHAVSPCGALGLGQLMPDTARRMGVKKPFGISDNLMGCTKYLHQLLSLWACKKKPLTLTIASYNAGPGAVKKFHGVPPYAETQNYVHSVLAYYHDLGGVGH